MVQWVYVILFNEFTMTVPTLSESNINKYERGDCPKTK